MRSVAQDPDIDRGRPLTNPSGTAVDLCLAPQRLGYLERVPDPSDRRAKLIRPTRRGRRLLVAALRAVREIEEGYAGVVGEERYATMVSGLQVLVDGSRRP